MASVKELDVRMLCVVYVTIWMYAHNWYLQDYTGYVRDSCIMQTYYLHYITNSATYNYHHAGTIEQQLLMSLHASS